MPVDQINRNDSSSSLSDTSRSNESQSSAERLKPGTQSNVARLAEQFGGSRATLKPKTPPAQPEASEAKTNSVAAPTAAQTMTANRTETAASSSARVEDAEQQSAAKSDLPPCSCRKKKFSEKNEQHQAISDTYSAKYAQGKKYHSIMMAGSGESGANVKAKFDAGYKMHTTPGANLPANVSSLANLTNWSVMGVDVSVKSDPGKKPYHLFVANHKSENQSIIFVGSAYKSEDTNTKEATLPFSDVLAHVHQETSGSKPLTHIVQCSIENYQTLQVIDGCKFKNIGEKAQPKTWSLNAGHDEFLALLGTDNVKTLAFIVKDHGKAIGVEAISSVTTYNQSHLVIGFQPRLLA